MKYSRALLASAVFVILLFAIYYLHVRFFKVDVVFYSALFDAALAALITTVLVASHRYFAMFSRFERVQLAAIWLMAGYIYAISVPTVIDRSLSFYILEKMQQQGGAVRMDRFEELFTKGYAQEHALVAVRLTEQEQSGTVTISDGCVKLTARGAWLASFSRYFRQHLLPRQRLLMGTYTDRLTEPFVNGPGDQVTNSCP